MVPVVPLQAGLINGGTLTVNAFAQSPPNGVYGRSAQVAGVGERALEDVGKRTLGHGVVRDAARLGATSQDRAFQSRVVEPEHKLVLVFRDLLLLHVLETFVAELSLVGNGHGEEETRVIVTKLFVLLRRRSKTDINLSSAVRKRTG